jgi:polyhydroxybutyrate depolymerase
MRRGLASTVLAEALVLVACQAFAQSGDTGKIRHQDIDRNYILHRPTGPVGARPLMIALHGINNSLDWRHGPYGLRASWTMDAVADREGFAVVYPSAVSGRWSYSAQRPVPLPGREELVDDLGFLGALIDKLVAEGVADPARVFVAGASRGALMTWTMACAMSDRIAGAAPLISGMTDGQLPSCRPERPMPLLALAGTEDQVQIYDGWLYPNYRLLSVPETIEFWRRLRRCTGQTGRALPHRRRADRTRVLQVNWTGCMVGGPIRLLRIEGGGHNLPTFTPMENPPSWAGARSFDIETAEEIWRFFTESAAPKLSD